jgi:hypothetical protein
VPQLRYRVPSLFYRCSKTRQYFIKLLHRVLYLFLFLEKERKEKSFNPNPQMQEVCIGKWFAENVNIFFPKGWQNKQKLSFNAASLYYMGILRKLKQWRKLPFEVLLISVTSKLKIGKKNPENICNIYFRLSILCRRKNTVRFISSYTESLKHKKKEEKKKKKKKCLKPHFGDKIWGITSCSDLKVKRHFGGSARYLLCCCFLLAFVFDLEDGGDIFLRNVFRLSIVYKIWCPRR